jgi:hypothetical protein
MTRTNINDFIAGIEETGFQKAGEFAIDHSSEERFIYPKASETLYVYAHPKGLLLTFDTYDHGINGARLHFELRPKTDRTPVFSTGYISGGFNEAADGQFIYDGDLRFPSYSRNMLADVGLAIGDLEKQGHLQNPFEFLKASCLVKEQDYDVLSKTHGVASDDYNNLFFLADMLGEQRLKSLPSSVQRMMGFEGEENAPAADIQIGAPA